MRDIWPASTFRVCAFFPILVLVGCRLFRSLLLDLRDDSLWTLMQGCQRARESENSSFLTTRKSAQIAAQMPLERVLKLLHRASSGLVWLEDSGFNIIKKRTVSTLPPISCSARSTWEIPARQWRRRLQMVISEWGPRSSDRPLAATGS